MIDVYNNIKTYIESFEDTKESDEAFCKSFNIKQKGGFNTVHKYILSIINVNLSNKELKVKDFLMEKLTSLKLQDNDNIIKHLANAQINKTELETIKNKK